MIDGGFVDHVCWSIVAQAFDRLPQRDLRP